MKNFSQKIPLAISLANFTEQTVQEGLSGLGQVYPCTVKSVGLDGSGNAVVTVNFEINPVSSTGTKITLPEVTMPIAESEYVRLPVQVGDKGIAVSASVRLGGITGLGTGLAPLSPASNLGALVFMPISNAKWTTSFPGVNITTNLHVDGNITSTTGGATGSITTTTGQIITIQNGAVTNICPETPSPTDYINKSYFQSIIDDINNCTSCDQLQKAATDYIKSLVDQQTAIEEQQASLAPALALLNAPTNPTAAVTWITNYINDYLAPQLEPSINYQTQLTETYSQIIELLSAIANAQSKFTSCSINLPPVPPLPT
jgi:hypothetical protein